MHIPNTNDLCIITDKNFEFILNINSSRINPIASRLHFIRADKMNQKFDMWKDNAIHSGRLLNLATCIADRDFMYRQYDIITKGIITEYWLEGHLVHYQLVSPKDLIIHRTHFNFNFNEINPACVANHLTALDGKKMNQETRYIIFSPHNSLVYPHPFSTRIEAEQFIIKLRTLSGKISVRNGLEHSLRYTIMAAYPIATSQPFHMPETPYKNIISDKETYISATIALFQNHLRKHILYLQKIDDRECKLNNAINQALKDSYPDSILSQQEKEILHLIPSLSHYNYSLNWIINEITIEK